MRWHYEGKNSERASYTTDCSRSNGRDQNVCSRLLHRLELSLQPDERVGRVHVEQCATAGAPLPRLIVKYGRCVADIADCRYPFHLAPFDRLEADIHGHERGQ